MKCHALFLLATATLSGCISDSSENGAVVLQYKRAFEIGRSAECDGNFKIAEDTYCWLIERGSCYGEYGLAILLLKLHPDRKKEAVRCLLSCAESSSHSSRMFPGPAMSLAFSIAAMNKLSEIAESELDRLDVAASLRSMMSDISTQEVKSWANTMKANEVSKDIFKDVIAAVESSHKHEEVVKGIGLDEISKIFLNCWQNNAVQKCKNQRDSARAEIKGERCQTKGKSE